MKTCWKAPNRRRVLGALATSVVAGPARAAVVRHPKASATTRAAAWLLGDNLSLAALMAVSGGADPSRTLFGKATDIAGGLGIALAPLPARQADKAAALAAASAYVIQGGGAAVGAELAKGFGEDHRTLYELSARTNLMVVLYAPTDGSDAAETIERRSKEVSLPAQLWTPLVSAIRDKQTEAQIKDLVFKMHKGVADFLVARVE